MSTANKLSYLNDTKSLLRTSLNKFGSNIITTDTFRSYDTKLNDIYDKLPKVTQSGAGFTLSDVQNGQVDDFKINGVDLSQSGTPTPDNPQEIKVVEGRQVITDKGKNLLNNQMTSQTLSGVEFTVNADKSITMSGTASERVEPRLWTKSGTDTLILNNGETYYNYSNTRLIMRIASDYIAISNNEAYVPSADLNVDEVYFRVDTNETVDTTIYPMLTKINDNNYEPYHEPVSYNIDLQLENIYLAKIPNTSYKNKIYKNNGNWYFEKNIEKIILDGIVNLFLTKTGNAGNVYTINQLNDLKSTSSNDEVVKAISNYFKAEAYSNLGNLDNGIVEYRGSQVIRFKFGTNSSVDTLNKANQWLQNNNVLLYYVLATPVTTQITNTTLINQLEAISVHTGTNIFTITNDNNVIPEIEITRLKELEKLS